MRQIVEECSRNNIPMIGICDTDGDPTQVDFAIPGNDDSTQSMELYCQLFKEAILNAKERREQDRKLGRNKKERDDYDERDMRDEERGRRSRRNRREVRDEREQDRKLGRNKKERGTRL